MRVLPRMGRGGAVLTALLLLVLGLPALIGLLGGFERTDGGQIAVVRNGGFFDNTRIRQVIDPGSGRVWVGWWSKVHKYPAQQRFYTITSNLGESTRGGGGVDVVTVPSSDGVNMGIEGTLYFTLNLDHEVLKKFDDKFGTRKFRSSSGHSYYAWQDEGGWSAFLNQIVRPVIDNNLRSQINSFRCAELVSSCALVQNTGSNGRRQTTSIQAQSNNGNIAKVQNAINVQLANDLRATLGGDFLTNIHFNLVRVTLPAQVQQAVDRAQAAFAQVTEAQARVDQAKLEAAANKARQDGYNRCPTCAEIEKLKALPQGITVYAPGNPSGALFPRD
ncbi:Regulator of protease activity HflC, stomatin/prohibitin superfamily [Thermomonospora echinospora]|uniref:Regulator of protease activity HflC, stomatin/prohibitin superfamily n=1 Tax=Thermomonospora echinospora TaxID=1992 RepID=A0A1H6BHG6_9ACTN|nr:SPFH domain-containing protein [Thermomonospora echinospora]SEG60173.1 Regulator of protease activity HflC, stomatin/prohibitin superfamily [Thermomonospora echinospora]